MADLTITAASVVQGANARVQNGVLGEAVTAGKAGYLDAATNTLKLADSNSATPAVRHATGVFLNGGAAGQPAQLQIGGDLTLGATLTPGAAYYLSDTPGGICPDADVGAGEYVCLLGIAKSASVIAVDPQFPNVAR